MEKEAHTLHEAWCGGGEVDVWGRGWVTLTQTQIPSSSLA